MFTDHQIEALKDLGFTPAEALEHMPGVLAAAATMLTLSKDDFELLVIFACVGLETAMTAGSFRPSVIEALADPEEAKEGHCLEPILIRVRYLFDQCAEAATSEARRREWIMAKGNIGIEEDGTLVLFTTYGKGHSEISIATALTVATIPYTEDGDLIKISSF